jgi:hypothetical protein
MFLFLKCNLEKLCKVMSWIHLVQDMEFLNMGLVFGLHKSMPCTTQRRMFHRCLKPAVA